MKQNQPEHPTKTSDTIIAFLFLMFCLGIIILMIVPFSGNSSNNGETDVIWRDTTRTVDTVTRDGSGNVIDVQSEVINGQVNDNGFFAPEWHPD